MLPMLQTCQYVEVGDKGILEDSVASKCRTPKLELMCRIDLVK